MPPTETSPFPLVAVDVGNSSIKLGLFEDCPPDAFPVPARSATLRPELPAPQSADWLGKNLPASRWWIASVQRTTTARLVERLEACGAGEVRLLGVADLPLSVEMPEPQRVGLDRLVNAVAANHLRSPARSAIVIDVGSAITVDLIRADGVFVGGAILPGIGMAARALHEFTDLLPLSEMTELREAPEALGKNTTAALKSGLFWGAVGAMRELIARLAAHAPQPEVFLTGGAAPDVARYLAGPGEEPPRHVPHLTLAGIALSARSFTG